MTDTTIDQDTRVSFLWLEITGECQLACEHCYADSGPAGSHGSMTGADWMRVIDEAAELGVSDVKVDHLRKVGRGIRDRGAAMDQLCGNCAGGVLAISPNGEIRPCVFARWIAVGNMREGSLGSLVFGAERASAQEELRRHFASRTPVGSCSPHCTSNAACTPDCNPSCIPQARCGPKS
ncbi:MAG: hypothetical protein GEU83_06435 [Pseudonocardiaceae bacterium]|nr:hypothetical protein [Pseudonocardiaceae bacterium]